METTMPTFEAQVRFLREYTKLPAEQRLQFDAARRQFVLDIKAQRPFKASLNIHQMSGYPGIFEMSWGQGGRATFAYGAEKIAGERHIIWRRIGGHEIYNDP